MIPSVMSGLGHGLRSAFSDGLAQLPTEVSTTSVMRFAADFQAPALLAILPLFLVLMIVGLASGFGQVGFVLSAEPMQPKWEKINPATGLKRIFSMRSTFEGVKALAKMVLFGLIVYVTIRAHWADIVSMSWMPARQALGLTGQILHDILIRVAIVWLVIAVADYIFQRMQIEKQLKMTKDELKREMREMEGSPELKMAQSQRRRKLLKGGMATKLKTADVLITNPTHFAIAITYDRSKMHAPMVLAKGQDFLALRMKQIAKDLKVPIVENKPLARALYRQCEAGDYVPRDLFGPVAEVLAYVYKTFQRVRGR